MIDIRDLRLSAGVVSGKRPMSLGEFCDASISFLKRLRSVHPLFRDGLFFVGSSRKDSVPLASDLSNAEQWILTNAWDRTAPVEWFKGIVDGQLSRDSLSQLSYSFSVSNLEPASTNEVQISVTAGGTGDIAANAISIDFPVRGFAHFQDREFCKRLLGFLIECWTPERGSVVNQALWAATEVSRHDASLVHGVGWLQYFADRRVIEALPPDVETEPFGPDGVLLTLQADAPVDEQTLASAIGVGCRIRDALLPGQWLVHPAQRTAVR